MNEQFRKFAQKVSIIVGSPLSFTLSVAVIICWALMGPMFHYSDTWQLIINTGTTIITFLMVFLIQNTQNRDAKSIQLKVDELIRANKHARNQMINLEALSDVELDHLHDELSELHKETEERLTDIRSHRKKRSLHKK